MSDRADAGNDAARKALWAREVRSRLASLRLPPVREVDIVEELSQHLDDRWRELVASGASPDDAVVQALSGFRSQDVLARQMASLRQSHTAPPATLGAPTPHLASDLWNDLRYAARALARHRGFAAASVLTLALGIGATTAIFSVVYGVLLKPLPFDEPERLVDAQHQGFNHGPATYFTYRDNQRSLEAIGAWDTTPVSVTGGGEPEQVEALLVSHETLPILRVQPMLGRLLRPDEDAPGAPPRGILTHGYWQRRFGGAGDIVGRSIVVNGRPVEIVGVLSASFTFLSSNPSLVLPMQLDPAGPRGISFGFQALARLKPGVTLAQANNDMSRMIALLPDVFDRLELKPNVRPLVDDVVGDIDRVLWILMAAVGVVLLVACGNVANLFLIRAEARQQELATRAALGATYGRIARVLLSESVLLAFIGCVAGLLVTQAALRLLRTLAPAELPRVAEIGIHPPVLLFAAVISALSAAAFGMLAVWRFGKAPVTALTDRSAGDAPGRHRARNTLVVSQVALALMLLIVSGLMIRSAAALHQVDPGFREPADVQTFRVAIPPGLIRDNEQAARTHERIAQELAQVPGVTSVGMATHITMDGEDNGNSIFVEDVPLPGNEPSPTYRFKSFAPGYFETMGIPVVAGRSITWTEIFDERPVVMISAALARKYWGDPARAVGRRIRYTFPATAAWREIVGVAGDERDDGLHQPATPIVYWPMLNDGFRWRTMAYAVRSPQVGTPGFQRQLERAVWNANANLPLASVQTLEEIRGASMARTSFVMIMLTIAAIVAVLLGLVGIYGAISYVAAQRTREIGVRVALGAQLHDIRRMFLRQGLWLTVAGIGIGAGVAFLLARVMSGLLFGVTTSDPATYATVSTGLAVVALAATYLPARHAANVDPVVALRAD